MLGRTSFKSYELWAMKSSSTKSNPFLWVHLATYSCHLTFWGSQVGEGVRLGRSNSKTHGPSQTSWRLSEPNACLFFMGKSANKGEVGWKILCCCCTCLYVNTSRQNFMRCSYTIHIRGVRGMGHGAWRTESGTHASRQQRRNKGTCKQVGMASLSLFPKSPSEYQRIPNPLATIGDITAMRCGGTCCHIEVSIPSRRSEGKEQRARH